MHTFVKRFLKRFVVPIADVGLAPFLVLASIPMRIFRKIGPQFAPISRGALRCCGVWPLRRHYYDPLFHPADLSKPADTRRHLGGIDWNIADQLAVLGKMSFTSEFKEYLESGNGDVRRYSLDNGTFASGDGDYLYNFIRLFKPRKILEIGCGNSTLVMRAAEIRNKADGFACQHICVEPYENPWLERIGVQVFRSKVETLELEYFQTLESGDLLFIDSSHMIRRSGDVVFEILELLPTLKPGVFVHFHDIFSPNDYLTDWLTERVYLWNEQYLLEGFLSFNSEFRIVGALNALHHWHYDKLASICVAHDRHREPGSFYIQRLA